MESTSLDKRPTFELLRARLLACVNKRVLNGEFSERGLARLLGVSQPQIHNVLKGERTLHIDLADRLLLRLEINLLDLFEIGEIQRLVNFLALRNSGMSEVFPDVTGDRRSVSRDAKKPMGRVRRNPSAAMFDDLQRQTG